MMCCPGARVTKVARLQSTDPGGSGPVGPPEPHAERVTARAAARGRRSFS